MMKIKFCFNRVFPARTRPLVPDAACLPHPRDRIFLSHAVVNLISAIGLVMTGPALAASWETSSMRTPSGGLIRIGTTRQEVLNEIGQSQHAQTATRGTAKRGKSGKKGSSLTYRGIDGHYTLTFSGDRVVKIVVTPDRD